MRVRVLVARRRRRRIPWIPAPYRWHGDALAGTTRPESPWPCDDRNRKMKIGRRRVVLSIVWWSHASPPLLDSGLRRNDEWGAGLTKGCREWRMSGCRERSIFIAIAHAGCCRRTKV